MKKICALILTFCMLVFSSCTVYVGDEEIQADVVRVEKVDKTEEAEMQEEEIEELEEAEEPIENATDVDALINNIGGIGCEKGETYEMAQAFCTALKEKDYNKLSELTMGEPEYYTFLDEIEFSEFALFPFAFTEEKEKSILDSGKYPVYGETYLVVIDVDCSENEYFKNGENLFYLSVKTGGYYEQEITFAPFEQIDKHIAEGWEYLEYFIDEVISLDSYELTDGENPADSFDFSYNPHLITHLMAKSGQYNSTPPFSLDEINDYIARAFSGNKGISLEAAEACWKHNIYESDDPNQKYGCSYAHGGDSSELIILDIRRDGSKMEVDVQTYCDFAHFAKAVKFTYVFSNADDAIPQLDYIIKFDNTGRTIAGTAY